MAVGASLSMTFELLMVPLAICGEGEFSHQQKRYPIVLKLGGTVARL
jgi:hypothetical protein